jgi:uncharacterized membrane protein (DUF373 family)
VWQEQQGCDVPDRGVELLELAPEIDMASTEDTAVSAGRINRVLNGVEYALYVTIAVLLSVAAATLLGATGWNFVTSLGDGHLGEAALLMLNELLLVLMMIELLHTVRVSVREHVLNAEPFLIVALIAGVRRILVITAEAWHLGEADPAEFNRAMTELGLITILTVALVVAVILLRRFKVTLRSKD